MNFSAPHVLVIDDDERLRALLGKFLSDQGFAVGLAADASEARAQMSMLSFDLLVLDRMMPGEDGLAFAKSLRAAGQIVPILMLTAMGEAEHRIDGLEGGADDYLAKPFEPRELVLRIQSILKRAAKEIAPAPLERLKLGGLVYDRGREALMQGDDPVHLTTAEATLLSVLAQAPSQVLSREELAEKTGVAGNLRTVDVQVTRLRKKLMDDAQQPRYLQTVRGRGYILKPD
ncbi:DNA-binding response regulator in two-component regulatory system with EnvZ [Rhodospirillaceae bacterium LM-1]|nr:DNA-binding response regulator in two-component regulatory system with EnvZ [Rhodospirillaceae bacterium LM-1]